MEPQEGNRPESDSEQEQDEVDQEQDGNVFWATAKAMESQRPDKVSIHISAASGLGKLACNMGRGGGVRSSGERNAELWAHVCAMRRGTRLEGDSMSYPSSEGRLA